MSHFRQKRTTIFIMDISFFDIIKSSFSNLVENEINTLSKLTLSEVISVVVGFIFILAGCFLGENT